MKKGIRDEKWVGGGEEISSKISDNHKTVKQTNSFPHKKYQTTLHLSAFTHNVIFFKLEAKMVVGGV